MLAKQEGIENEIKELLEREKFEEAAECLINRYGDPHVFGDEIEAHFGPHRIAVDFVPRPETMALAKLTNGSIVTTNYDQIIERTFEFLGVPIVPIIGAPRSATKGLLEGDAKILLKIHGHATEITGRILTEQDYDQHYGKVAGQGYDPELPLPRALSEIMRSTPLLFLGCSLANDRTMLVLGAIAKTYPDRRHFAIVEKPKESAELIKRRRQLRSLHIIPIWYQVENKDHRLLRELLLHLTSDLPDPSPKPQPKLPKGQLTGPTDARLQPNEPLFGRKEDLDAVRAWLNSTTSIGTVYSTATVKGAPGIGKSRLCHRIIQEYLRGDGSPVAFYIPLQSANGLGGLWEKIAEAYEWRDTEFADFPRRMDEIGGLIYLDNLEDVLDDARVIAVLKQFEQFQQARILNSSRQSLGVIGRNISLERLDDTAAEDLFHDHWKRSGGAGGVMTQHLSSFIHEKLDNHPLSIKLVASLAESYSDPAGLIQAWETIKTRLATTANPQGKDESLDISITLSYERLLSRNPEAIQAWATVAMFPEGMSVRAQKGVFSEDRFLPTSPVNQLIHFSLAESQADRITMLAPLQQYILGRFERDRAGFPGGELYLDRVFEYLLELALLVDLKYFTHDGDRSEVISQMLDEFASLSQLLLVVKELVKDWPERVSILYDQLHNLFNHRILLGQRMLMDMVQLFRKARVLGSLANALKSLGDIESRLSNAGHSRELYEEAFGHYKTVGANRGLANVLNSLASLEHRLGNVDSARVFYLKAIDYYKAERSNLGLANAIKGLGDLESGLGKVDSARKLYEKAIGYYKTEHSNLGVANALKRLGDLESRQGKFEEARALYEEAIGHYKGELDLLGLANALKSLGELENSIGNVGNARILYEESIVHYKTERDSLGLANAQRSLGDLERRQGNLDTARTLYEKAIGQFRTDHNFLGLANVLKSLGDLESRLGMVDSARSLYAEAISQFKTVRDHLGLANALKSLGDLDRRLGNVNSARALYEEAIGHYKTERDHLGLANVLKSIGELESELGNVDSARALYENAIEHYKAERYDMGQAYAELSLGLLELEVGDANSAESSLLIAIQLFEKLQDPMGLAQTLALHSLLLHNVGQSEARNQTYAQALHHAEASHTPGVIAYVQNVGNAWLENHK